MRGLSSILPEASAQVAVYTAADYIQLRSASALGAAVLAARGIGVSLPVPATTIDVTPAGRDGDELDQRAGAAGNTL